MNVDDYQKDASRTLPIEDEVVLTKFETGVCRAVFGLAGEAGEVVELFKKAIFHKHGLPRGKLKEELGDLLWYVSALATLHGISMSEIMTFNVAKLQARYPEGFNKEDSIKRVDVETTLHLINGHVISKEEFEGINREGWSYKEYVRFGTPVKELNWIN